MSEVYFCGKSGLRLAAEEGDGPRNWVPFWIARGCVLNEKNYAAAGVMG